MNDRFYIHTDKGFTWKPAAFRPPTVRSQEVEAFANSRWDFHLTNELNPRKKNLLMVSAFMAVPGASQAIALPCGETGDQLIDIDNASLAFITVIVSFPVVPAVPKTPEQRLGIFFIFQTGRDGFVPGFEKEQ